MLIASLFIYVPGALIFRALYFPRFFSLVLAPIASLVGYGIISLVCGALGVSINWFVLFVGLLCFGILCLLISHQFTGFSEFSKQSYCESKVWKYVCLYLIVGVFVAGWVYVRTLDGPSSFIPGNDNTTHLGTIHQFLVTGNWSTLQDGYYPRGWAGLAAMVAQSMSVTAPFAANVFNTVVAGVIYPLSMLGFFVTCFKKQQLVIVCGSVSVLAFTAFPWNVLAGSPISPNVLGFALVPTALMLLMLLFQGGLLKKQRTIVGISLLLYCVSCVFSHPNALFTAGVFFIPYCVYQIISCDNQKLFPNSNLGKKRRFIAVICFLLIVVLVWSFFYWNPLLSSVTSFTWEASASLKQALFYTASLSFYDNPAQWVVACLVLIGVFYSLARRQYLWITFGFLIFCLLYILNVTTDGFAKQFLTGFWYTASRRLASAAVIMGVPLLALGIFSCIRCFQYAVDRVIKKESSQIIPAVILVCFLGINFFPSFNAPGATGQVVTPFGYMSDRFQVENQIEGNWILDQEERDFFAKVKEITGSDVVYNLPYDGSAFAYALNDIDVYYRHFSSGRDEASTILQSNLNNATTSSEVQRVLGSRGIHWLMILDYRGGEYDTVSFDHELWQGVLGVQDGTPGFETVLSEGDMRLFRIQI